MVAECLQATTAQYAVLTESVDPGGASGVSNAPGAAIIAPTSNYVQVGGARGKLKMKRCPNGSRRNKKTRKCVKKGKKSTNSAVKSFLKGIKSRSKSKSSNSAVKSFLKGIKSRSKSRSKSKSSNNPCLQKYKTPTQSKHTCKADDKRLNNSKRKAPPIAAKSCAIGLVKIGKDKNKWQIVKTKRGKRWAKCSHKNTKC
jgi:hypothetical protein